IRCIWRYARSAVQFTGSHRRAGRRRRRRENEMDELEVITAGERVMPGEGFLGETLVLRRHAGTQPDLFLRWNEISLTTRVVDVVILAAHAGGGMPAIDAIAGASRLPDEFYVFDGLYGRDPAGGDPMQGLETIDRWLGERLVREPERGGALRVIYIEQQTGPFSRKVAELIARHLAEFEPAMAERSRRRYR